jgi:DNA-binding transcriptional LysR family regulator
VPLAALAALAALVADREASGTGPSLAVGSDLTGLVPARYARQVAVSTGAHCYEVPVTLPTLTMSQAWHVRQDLDPAHHWLRTQIAAALSDGYAEDHAD